jgi:FlaA1/EpsC-like NDP-sugar epimerase
MAQDTLAFVLDPIILSLAYYFAYFLRFKAAVPQDDIRLFLYSWPLVVAAKFVALWIFGIYRYSWWRGSVGDAYRLAKAVVVGEVAAVLLLTALYRFNGYSRVVFCFDCLASWLMLLGLRRSFALFRGSMALWKSAEPTPRRVFVLGTSEHAELVLSFLKRRRIECAGLIDTNGGGDLHRRVWGTQVVGHLDDLIELAGLYGVSEVILPENEELPYSETEFYRRHSQDVLKIMKLGLYSPEPAGSAQSFGFPIAGRSSKSMSNSVGRASNL